MRSGSSMKEDAADFFVHLLARPVGMLMLNESRFVAARRPVKSMCDTPALLRRHPAERLELFRAGLFVGQHGRNFPEVGTHGKLVGDVRFDIAAGHRPALRGAPL